MTGILHKFLLKLYRFYHLEVYLRYKDIRGVTFVRRNLAKLVAMSGGAEFPEGGKRVVEKEWDNLIVLDAGRKDILEELAGREISSIISKGSSSYQWLQENFKDSHDDIVMVTGNPYIHKFSDRDPEEIFCDVYDAWDYNYNNRFMDPGAVNAALKDALREHEGQDKRFIIHYMQPHFPIHNDDRAPREIWDDARGGQISIDELRDLYADNYRFVLEKGVREAVKRLEGKTIVSADHAQLLGEYGLFSHPSNLDITELLEVPWVKAEELLEDLE